MALAPEPFVYTDFSIVSTDSSRHSLKPAVLMEKSRTGKRDETERLVFGGQVDGGTPVSVAFAPLDWIESSASQINDITPKNPRESTLVHESLKKSQH